MGSGSSGLYAGAKGTGKYVAGNRDYMRAGELFSVRIARRKDVDPQGFYDVIAHGTEKTILVEHNGETAEITHRAFVQLMKKDPEWKGRAVRLLSCDTGKVAHGFAQGLADRLGVPVKAPTELVWADWRGGYFVAAGKMERGKLVPDKTKPGDFVTYYPRRRQK